jgi:hypothetical protein
MSGNGSGYGTMLLNVKEENDRDTSEASFVLACGVKMSMDHDKDGNEFWSSMISDEYNHSMEFNAETYFGAIEKMYSYLKFGKR